MKPPDRLTPKERSAMESLARDYITKGRSNNEIFLNLKRRLSIREIEDVRIMMANRPKPRMANIKEVK